MGIEQPAEENERPDPATDPENVREAQALEIINISDNDALEHLVREAVRDHGAEIEFNQQGSSYRRTHSWHAKSEDEKNQTAIASQFLVLKTSLARLEREQGKIKEVLDGMAKRKEEREKNRKPSPAFAKPSQRGLAFRRMMPLR